MTRGQYETAKEIVQSVNYLEHAQTIFKNGDDVRFVLRYFDKDEGIYRELDLSYLDKDSAEILTTTVSELIENRIKVYNTRLEEL